MKLLTKLTLFSAITSIIIVVLFILLLPFLVKQIAFDNTDRALFNQKQKVLKEVKTNGIDYYLQGYENYGSYSMLKDEYISLEPTGDSTVLNKLLTDNRIVEGDTITYRILRHSFAANNHINYLLEIGKKIETIRQSGKDLQMIALYALLTLTLLTLITTYAYNKYLIAPLGHIISSKLIHKKIPFRQHNSLVKTSTYDFKYLDNSIATLMKHINYAFEKEREFTSNASHELMTPISIMQSKIENMMMDESLERRHYIKLEEMMATLKRLRKIVKSLLFISRMDNHQFERNDNLTPLSLIHEVVAELNHRLEEKRVRLNIEMNHNPLLKKVNKDLLFQLCYNLINNAIKYNKEGGSIIINDSFNTKNKTYTISVTDEGVGIAETNLKEIFHRFKKTNQSKEGYGLGLSIVKSIIQYHDMGIETTSVENKGSSFHIIFNASHVSD